MDPLEDNNLNYARLLSLGYGEAHAREIVSTGRLLKQGTLKLNRRKQGPSRANETEMIRIAAFIYGNYGNPDTVLLHDDILLPSWKTFADTLSSITTHDHGFIHIHLGQVHLGTVVSDMLLQSFKTAPLLSLTLKKNDLGADGIKFVVNAVKMNATLEALYIHDNHIESGNDAACIVRAVDKHPKVDRLTLENCDIGQSDAVMSAIVPAVFHLRQVSLRGNNIGSHGAILISSSITSNPGIEKLLLNDNLLNDDDATMFAESLRTNTKLRMLNLMGNHITELGINALSIAVLGTDINAINDSNHTCWIFVGDGSHRVNTFDDPKMNREEKMLNALCHLTACDLDDVPVGIMPRVLDLLQRKVFPEFEINDLELVFDFFREMSMSLLRTIRIGPELRRSDYIRKKMVMHYMRD